MSDFKTALIEVVETAAPELEGKLQCGAVDAETPAPFATYSTPDQGWDLWIRDAVRGGGL